MGLNLILTSVVVYISLGIILLVIFDLATKRIRSKFTQATNETQSRLVVSGSYVGNKLASALFLGAMWLFWPMVFIGALTDRKESDDE